MIVIKTYTFNRNSESMQFGKIKSLSIFRRREKMFQQLFMTIRPTSLVIKGNLHNG